MSKKEKQKTDNPLPSPEIPKTLEVQDGVGKFPMAGHLADQMLKKGLTRLPSLLDCLDDETKIDIANAKVDFDEVIEGVNLTASQNELVLILSKLRHKKFKSIVPPESTSNIGDSKMVVYGQGENKEQTPAPIVVITPYELAKEYKGGSTPTGKDVSNIEKVLDELNNTKHLIRVKEKHKKKNGKWVEVEIQGYRSLLHKDIMIVRTGDGDKIHTERKVLVITLNPIFIRQIERKYVSMPVDFRKRTIEANGSARVATITLNLRLYLARVISSKHSKHTISVENLYNTLAPDQMERSRIGEVKKATDKALTICKRIGLLEKYIYSTGKNGDLLITFTLPKEWK